MGTTNAYLNAMRGSGGADEKYTTYKTVDDGLSEIAGLLRGKSVYCNCDNPFTSQFVAWLLNNFTSIGISRLEATCIAGNIEQGTFADLNTECGKIPGHVSQREPLTGAGSEPVNPGAAVRHLDGNAWHATVTHVDKTHIDADRLAQLYAEPENSVRIMDGDGSFDSPECLDILDRCDAVLTNPPFSRFKTFIQMLVLRKKKFAVIGDLNAASYRTVFELIRAGSLWLGPVPAYWFTDIEGLPFRLKSGVWYTNLGRRPERSVQELPARSWTKWRASIEGILDIPKLDAFPTEYNGPIGVPLSWLRIPDPAYEMLDIRPLRMPQPNGSVKRTFQRVIVKKRGAAQSNASDMARNWQHAALDDSLQSSGQWEQLTFDGMEFDSGNNG